MNSTKNNKSLILVKISSEENSKNYVYYFDLPVTRDKERFNTFMDLKKDLMITLYPI